MAITASSLIEDVARYLSDYEEDESYVHWTEEDLLSYFKRAVGVVAGTKKEKFFKQTTVKLQPGSMQEVPDNCQSDISVRGVLVDGVVQERLRRASLFSLPPIGRKPCKNCKASISKGYKVKSFDFDPANPRTIMVDPPVPEGEDVELSITCFIPPEVTSMDSEVDLGADMEAVIFELMLYYAWGVDIEDNASRERSNQHWNNAITLLQLDAKLQQLARRIR